MSFEKLLGDLEELQKSKSLYDKKDDANIKEASGVDDEDEDFEDTDNDDEDESEDDEDNKGKKPAMPLGKSMNLVLADGSSIEAIDGAEMIKSLQGHIDLLQKERITEREHLAKSLSVIHDMLKEYGESIAAISKRVDKVAHAGRGRQSVVSVVESVAKSQPVTPSTDAVMDKMISAQSTGRVTAMDVAVAEAALNRGMPIPQSIVSKLSD